MNSHRNINLYKLFSFFFILLSIIFFFYGFIIGEKSSYSNKVNFSEPGNIINKIKSVAFSANNFREIISVNKHGGGVSS